MTGLTKDNISWKWLFLFENEGQIVRYEVKEKNLREEGESLISCEEGNMRDSGKSWSQLLHPSSHGVLTEASDCTDTWRLNPL